MKIVKTIFSILIIPYVIIAIFTTACLMNYNKYGITEFGNKSLIIVEDNSLEPTFKKGNLLVVKRNENLESVKPGDSIFFYNNYNNEVSVSLSNVLKRTKVNDKEYTYTIDGNYDVSSEYYIGSVNDTSIYSFWGTLLGVFTSRIGYLLIFVLPILCFFLYEIYAVIREVKEYKEEKQ
ncbi:hypothetical protein EGR52_11255 [bacterium]|nr:hypothetical protein [bacterium]